MPSISDIYADVKLNLDAKEEARVKRKIASIDASKGGAKVGAKFGSGFTGGLSGAIGKAAGPIAVAFAAVKGVQIFSGFIKDAAESERISRITANAIRATGGAAKISADQVSALATSISNKTAIDDEQIQTAANMLLTFKGIRNEAGAGNDVFNQATQAAADLSIQFGGMDSASKQLGKALNDPIKGTTALAKAGVTFTDQQKKQIATLVKSGDVLGAQKIILKEIQGQVGGAAAAAADPMDRLSVIAGNLGEKFGLVLLPHVEKFANFLADEALPALDRFGTWVTEHSAQIGLAFLGIAEGMVKTAKLFLPPTKVITENFLNMVGTLLEGAARIDDALGGKLGLREKADDFKTFSAGVSDAFDTAIAKTGEWDTALDKTQKTLELKANVQDLESKLKKAKESLNDKGLTMPRRAEIRGDIRDLTKKLAAAKSKAMLADPKLVQARVATLKVNKTDLDAKITAAKKELNNPNGVTKTRRTKLTADIKELQRKRVAAQREINSLKGKTVTVDLKFTSGGVNLTAPSSVGRRALGGPGGPTGFKVRGPGGPTADQAGIFALSNKEWVIRAKSSQQYGDKAMASINAGTATVIPGMADGGKAGTVLNTKLGNAINAAIRRLDLSKGFGRYGSALMFARSQAGKPYGWGAAGPGSYDCSGFMGAIVNYIRGKSPYSRVGSTGTFPWPGFSRGSGVFSIGSFRGNPGHMAGTLLGVNVESRGGEGVVTGPRARGARNSLFGGNVYHMARGGNAGDAAFDLFNPRGKDYIGDPRLLRRAGIDVFDNGGQWRSGTLGYNGSGTTETVVAPGQPMDLSRGTVKEIGKAFAQALKETPMRLTSGPGGAYTLQVSNG